jgi:hypothetical protein
MFFNASGNATLRRNSNNFMHWICFLHTLRYCPCCSWATGTEGLRHSANRCFWYRRYVRCSVTEQHDGYPKSITRGFISFELWNRAAGGIKVLRQLRCSIIKSEASNLTWKGYASSVLKTTRLYFRGVSHHRFGRTRWREKEIASGKEEGVNEPSMAPM